MIPSGDIFSIRTREDFDRAALALFAFQAERCEPYARYLSLIGVRPEDVDSVERIPFMPVELFKSHDIYCGAEPPEKVFTSSGTTGMVSSRHPMASLSLYEECFTRAFEMFYGPVAGWSIYALLPSYLEREGSSLVYMMDGLIKKSRGGGFYLYDHDALLGDMRRTDGPKLLLGVSYALLDLAEKGEKLPEGTVVMETGGMKGRRKELPKQAMHEILCRGLGVETIHSEYGMAELTSQAYSQGGGIFRCPPWMRILVRDLNDPFDILGVGRNGGINIADLGNLYSCAFIQTQDAGRLHSAGSFTVFGRADRSEIRGCNLLVQ